MYVCMCIYLYVYVCVYIYVHGQTKSQCQKRPTKIAKETYYLAKETHHNGKRDLLKLPTT